MKPSRVKFFWWFQEIRDIIQTNVLNDCFGSSLLKIHLLSLSVWNMNWGYRIADQIVFAVLTAVITIFFQVGVWTEMISQDFITGNPKNILKTHFPLDGSLWLCRSLCPVHNKLLSSQMTENKNAMCNNCSCTWCGFEFSIK